MKERMEALAYAGARDAIYYGWGMEGADAFGLTPGELRAVWNRALRDLEASTVKRHGGDRRLTQPFEAKEEKE